MKSQKVSLVPQRFFGPVSEGRAEQMLDYILDEPELRDTLKRFMHLRGDEEMDVRMLAFELQIIMENTLVRILNSEPDAMDAASLEREREGA